MKERKLKSKSINIKLEQKLQFTNHQISNLEMKKLQYNDHPIQLYRVNKVKNKNNAKNS